MTTLKLFILVGIIDSFDNQFATVELNTDPPSNGGDVLAVFPISAFPCEVREGRRFYVVKLLAGEGTIIVCEGDTDEGGR